jgi:peptidoglycan/LPS O-acetylase OafA/YrhL
LVSSPIAPTPQLRPATPRFDGVDTLRGISILVVILLHINIHMSFSGHRLQTLFPRPIYHLLFTNGDNGVTLFFAISGFLITLTSIRRFGSLAAMRPAIFYRIRFARIAPLLLLLLAVLSVLHLADIDGFRVSRKVATLPQALFAALTFHINYLEAHARAYLPANWDVLWSLSVEEMFYLFFPLLCLLLYRNKTTRPVFIAVLLAFAAIGPYARSVLARGNPIWGDSSYLGGMDAIALGCLCAILTNLALTRVPHDQRAVLSEAEGRSFIVGSVSTPTAGVEYSCHSERSEESPHFASPPPHQDWPLLTLQLLGAALLLWIALWPRWHGMNFIGRHALDGTILPIGTCLILYSTVIRGKLGSRWTAPLRWAGRRSYELYLTHSFFVITAANLYHRLPPAPHAAPANSPATVTLATESLLQPRLSCILWTAAILVLSALLAAALHRYFTEPMNRRLRGAAPPHH